MIAQTVTSPPPIAYRRHAYSDQPAGLRPLPLGLSIGVTTTLFAAYLLAPPEIYEAIPDFGPITAINVEIDPPPPVDDPPPPNTRQPIKTAIVTPPQRFTISNQPPIGVVTSDASNAFAEGRVGIEPGIPIDLPPLKPPLPIPVLTAIKIDPRFADRFQPEYPPAMRRLDREGVARVRVLVGADGRVKEVRDAGSTDPAFFLAAKDQALGAWRFKPATRDGRPFAEWYTLSVTFELKG